MSQKASLEGAFAKLRCAREHLEAFEVEADWISEHVVQTTGFETRYDPDVPRFLVHVAEEPAVSIRLSTITGDLVQNLRSALDHLAYQLPILASGLAWEDTQWPIVLDASALNAWRFKGLRDRLVAAGRADLWAKVESHQMIGYVGAWDLTQRYRDLPLVVLNDLSNRDKHRLLIDPYVNVAEYTSITPQCIRDCTLPVSDEGWGLWFTLKLDAPPIVQFRATITGPDPKMEVDVDFIPAPMSLAYLPGPAYEWLVLLTDAVRTVLEDFAPDF